ncbi:hypothetical protein IL252_11115 [Halomicrobium sp. IBSBa]|uniref:hypothetical protein n=1 Tax=Halomicrobium sp. IBSBa TaxID=2778916 RepID=UPI001ABF70BF|nr:hypothetical protein [Halomicrobium sp. IBSBa]MBO4248363.1 hypothetical protein [Halomicrobium sp. IBSBa]
MSLDASLAPNKKAGIGVEIAITTDHVPALQLVPDEVAEHYDAVATTLVTPTADIPFVALCLLERGTQVEIKSTIVTYADGRRGRFKIRRSQHETLLEIGGVYLFAVCRDLPDRPPVALKVVPATTVDEVIHSWIDSSGTRSDYAQVSWGSVFDATEVDH